MRKSFLSSAKASVFGILALCPLHDIQAASFDCSIAATKIEKMICADAELSELDDELNRVYRKALQKSSAPEEFKESQRSWLEYWHKECDNVEVCVRYQWQLQIARLNQKINNPFHKLQDTTFRYDLEESYDDQVCRHMLEVFNTNFSAPWKHEEKVFLTGERSPETGYGIVRPNPSYEEHGKYAFPKLPGVEHDVDLTFEMRRSKLPTSPEFDLILWREGRRKLDEFTLPILAADFDIDNDGQIEMVLKTGFWSNSHVYAVSANDQDTYYVYHQSEIDPIKVEAYRTLGKKANYALDGYFFRPFIFKGKTYFTKHVAGWGIFEDSLIVEIPESEIMLIELYTKASGSDKPQAETICQYRMIAIQPIENSKENGKE